MLLANRTVAEYVSDQDQQRPIPSHTGCDNPDEEDQTLCSLCRKFGYSFDIHNEKQVARIIQQTSV